MKWLRLIAVLPIRFYRRYITRYTPPTCRFRPSCSAYGEQAILRHGIVKGLLLLSWRVLRCQPFSAPGPDPVPPIGHWKRDPCSRPATSESADDRCA